MTPENIKAGFKRTGIWPLDSDAIPDYLFAVNNESESSGSVWFSLELRIVDKFSLLPDSLKRFFYCKYMYT